MTAETAATTPSQVSPVEEVKSTAPWRVALKFLAAAGFAAGAVSRYQKMNAASISPNADPSIIISDESAQRHRRLSEVSLIGDAVPSYMDKTVEDLKSREKLFSETPEKEIKYWFEYTGPLQVCD
jgi:hypothetical protein